MYANPANWETTVAGWAGKYGDKTVLSFKTNRVFSMANAVRGYVSAILSGDVTHDGDGRVTQHLGNTRKQLTSFRDDVGDRLWTMHKERPDSPHFINAAVAAVLSWEARTHALASGAQKAEPAPPLQIFFGAD